MHTHTGRPGVSKDSFFAARPFFYYYCYSRAFIRERTYREFVGRGVDTLRHRPAGLLLYLRLAIIVAPTTSRSAKSRCRHRRNHRRRRRTINPTGRSTITSPLVYCSTINTYSMIVLDVSYYTSPRAQVTTELEAGKRSSKPPPSTVQLP